MNQIIKLKLNTNIYQAAALLKTMERFNEMCNDIAPIAYQMGTSNIREISDQCYTDMRLKHGLPSQLTVRAIARASGRYAEDKSRIHHFDSLEKSYTIRRYWHSSNSIWRP